MTPPDQSMFHDILENQKTEWCYKKAAEEIRQEAYFSIEKMGMNFFATIIATYGLLANNVPTIIGAMLLSMLLGPITGIALALAEGDHKLLKKALLIEFFGVALVFTTAFIIAKIHHEALLGDQVMDRTHPSIFDLAVALTCGTAVAFALVSKKLSASIIGVAISVSLTPPLAASGILFAHGEYNLALGAFLLFITNLVGIEFSASAVFWFVGYQRFFRREKQRLIWFLMRNTTSFIMIISLAVILSVAFRHTLEKQIYLNTVEKTLNQELKKFPHSQLVSVEIKKRKGYTWVIATIRTKKHFTYDDTRELAKEIPKYEAIDQTSPELEIREIPITEFYSNQLPKPTLP